MRLREHFSRLKVPTPSVMPSNECLQASPEGEVVLLEIDGPGEVDVLAMLLPRGSMPRKPRRSRRR